MFVLWGDGAVYSVLCHPREDWSVEGPLEMVPQQEDNYREEASSICVVGGSAGLAVIQIWNSFFGFGSDLGASFGSRSG
jgi:hypothetical protein